MGREKGSLVEVMTGFDDRFKGGGGGREGRCSGGCKGEETRLGGTSGTKSWTDAEVVVLLEGGGGGGLRASKMERSGTPWFNNLIGTSATRGAGGTRRRGGGGWVERVMLTSRYGMPV